MQTSPPVQPPLHRRLRVQLVTAFLVIGLGPLAFVVAYAYDSANDGYIKQVRKAAISVGEQVQLQIDRELTMAERQLRSMTTHTRAHSVPKVSLDGGEINVFRLLKQQFREFLDSHKRMLPIFSEILCVRPEDKSNGKETGAHVLYSNTGNREGTSVLPDLWQRDGKSWRVSPQYRWRLSDPNSDVEQRWLAIAHPFKDGQGNTLAFVGIIEPARLRALVKRNTTVREGVVDAEAQEEMVVALLGANNSVFASVTPNGKPSFGQIVDLTQKTELQSTGFAISSVPGIGEAVISISESAHIPGRVLVAQSTKTALAPVHRLRDAFFLSAALVIAIVILSGWYLSRRISSPVTKLMQGTQDAAAGNLEQAIAIHTSNELGLLADGFNKMLVRLREAFENQRRLAIVERDLEMTGVVQSWFLPPNPNLETTLSLSRDSIVLSMHVAATGGGTSACPTIGSVCSSRM